MGIYDREYIRREGPSFLGSISDRGLVCKWLIGINVGLFVLQMIAQQGQYNPITNALCLNAEVIEHGQVWRLLTAAFLHSIGDPWHILFNMLFLWWFGSEVEDLYGRKEFLAVYLTGAVVGNVAWMLWALHTGALLLGAYLLGASGAVTTVMLLCGLHYPRRIVLLFFVLPVPLLLLVVVYVAADFFMFLGGTQGQVGVTAHLGGALFGFLYYKLQWRLTGLLPQLKGLKRQLTRPRLRIHRAEEEERPTPAAVPAAPSAAAVPEDEQLEAKMDAVLEKISREGKDNLTDSEREVLRRASEIYRRRRR